MNNSIKFCFSIFTTGM
ncbi:hypothetical protein K0M23_003834 [Salmonella enterica]|nr:peptide IlvX [Salmonella enterica]EHY8885770.1 hypothetical protein [Salmonella enterica subsp. enterica serovar Kingston]QUZ30259.1 peptide IlvX [Salmonella enterica subsp. enterica serovar Saintpaul str. SARA26]HEC6391956.1 hypothetical protein [Salmonella enterica subsp. enterica serovar Warragul]EHV4612426.1 hypothetical protein [Salmonella enterica]EHV4621141.1 hypothetical protein [Salmonella enterica]